MVSQATKKYRVLSIIFGLLSLAATLAPLAYYCGLALVYGGVAQKATLGLMVTAAAIITVLNLLFKTHYRSAIWLVILGIYVCIQNLLPLLVMVAILTILDEFLLTPLYKSFKNKATINREIDKRL